jgi:hypothetical protein
MTQCLRPDAAHTGSLSQVHKVGCYGVFVAL